MLEVVTRGNQVNKGLRGVGGGKSIKDSCKREVDARGDRCGTVCWG